MAGVAFGQQYRVVHPRVPYGQERRFGRGANFGPECPYCGAKIGKAHSPGCQLDECSKCGGQVKVCGCAARLVKA